MVETELKCDCCGADDMSTAVMCDQDNKTYCTSCWSDTDCGNGKHHEGCQTTVFAIAETETLTVEEINRLQNKSRRGGGIYRADMDALFDMARRAATEIPEYVERCEKNAWLTTKLEAELATATAQVERMREALEALIDFHNAPLMEKRPDVFNLLMHKAAKSLADEVKPND
jgi:hypothetical protein